MSDTSLQIALDGSSTFETLEPLRNELAGLPEGEAAEISMDLVEDTPQTVLFALCQMLCSARKEDRVVPENLSALAEQHAPFGALLQKTGFAVELTNQ